MAVISNYLNAPRLLPKPTGPPLHLPHSCCNHGLHLDQSGAFIPRYPRLRFFSHFVKRVGGHIPRSSDVISRKERILVAYTSRNLTTWLLLPSPGYAGDNDVSLATSKRQISWYFIQNLRCRLASWSYSSIFGHSAGNWHQSVAWYADVHIHSSLGMFGEGVTPPEVDMKYIKKQTWKDVHCFQSSTQWSNLMICM